MFSSIRLDRGTDRRPQTCSSSKVDFSRVRVRRGLIPGSGVFFFPVERIGDRAARAMVPIGQYSWHAT